MDYHVVGAIIIVVGLALLAASLVANWLVLKELRLQRQAYEADSLDDFNAEVAELIEEESYGD